MLRNTRKGFTLIELLIVVVIVGILSSIAIPKFANSKDKAKISSMRTDLRNLVAVQEGHFADNNRYATAIGAAADPTTAVFFQTAGNAITIPVATPSGWSATISRNPQDLASPVTCGLFVGAVAAPNPAVTREGEVACW